MYLFQYAQILSKHEHLASAFKLACGKNYSIPQFAMFYIAQHKNQVHIPYPTNPRNMITMSINHSHFVRCLNEKDKD